MKNLWNSIRTKVFTNYSQKGLRHLVEWQVEKMSTLASSQQVENQADISKLELSEEELY